MDELERAQRNLKKNDPASLKKLGETLMAAGKFEDAVGAFSRALDLKDGDPALLNLLGNAWRAQKRHEETAYFYGKAVAAAPNYAVAHASLGDTFIALERYPEAVASLETSIRLAASESARMSLAYAYRKTGKDDLALDQYRKLVGTNPRNFRARLLMLRIFEDKGQFDEAYLEAKELLELVKNGPLADEARETYRRVSKKRRGEWEEEAPPEGAADPAPEPAPFQDAEAASPDAEDGEVVRLTLAMLREPSSVAAHLRLADRLFDLSRFDKACLLYRKALDLAGIGRE